MTTRDDDLLDNMFHGCAFAAFIEQAIEERRLPGMVATRRRAFRLYEEKLAIKNGRVMKRLPDECQ